MVWRAAAVRLDQVGHNAFQAPAGFTHQRSARSQLLLRGDADPEEHPYQYFGTFGGREATTSCLFRHGAHLRGARPRRPTGRCPRLRCERGDLGHRCIFTTQPPQRERHRASAVSRLIIPPTHRPGAQKCCNCPAPTCGFSNTIRPGPTIRADTSISSELQPGPRGSIFVATDLPSDLFDLLAR